VSVDVRLSQGAGMGQGVQRGQHILGAFQTGLSMAHGVREAHHLQCISELGEM
jgi:hypothetical protein